MSRHRDFREPRRRGFDDDFTQDRGFARPRSDDGPSFAAPSGPTLQAVVKWFNPEKGFGFVELTDGSGDVFMHARALEAAGHESVDPGATLTVRVGIGQKGRQVTEVVAVDASTAEARPQRTFRPREGGGGGAGGGGGFSRDRDSGPLEDLTGAVKWYNPEKGFGFIAPDRGGKDVFVHVTALQRSGVSSLAEGQRVRVSVGQGPKGPEVRMVEPLD